MIATQFDLDVWHHNFPRLAELRDAAEPTRPEIFYHSIPWVVEQNALAREAYQELENDLASLSDEAWRHFKSKLIRCDIRSHGHHGYRGIHSVLYEAKGHRRLADELQRRGVPYDRIVLIPEGRTKTPEWAAMNGETSIAALEVKTVYESDDESKYVYENTRRIRSGGELALRRGDPRIPEGFRQKLESTVARAKDQLNAYATDATRLRIAFLIIHFDHELTIVPDNYRIVANLLDRFNDGQFEVKYEFRR